MDWVRFPRVAKYQIFFDEVCVQNQCRGRKLEIFWKMTIIWWNKSKHIFASGLALSIFSESNSILSNVLRRISSVSGLRLHQPSYKVFCTRFGHVTKAKFFGVVQTIRRQTIAFPYGLCQCSKKLSLLSGSAACETTHTVTFCW